MKFKTITMVSIAIISLVSIGGVVLASELDNETKIIEKDTKNNIQIEKETNQSGNKELSNTNFNINSSNNPSKDVFQDMVKIMRDNGFNDMARNMQTGNYEAMDEIMNDLSEEDYQEMIRIMRENGYDSMAQMMESIGREEMIEMHNSMGGAVGCHSDSDYEDRNGNRYGHGNGMMGNFWGN
ncbi:MAG: hypothetical protein FH761_11815 [Firmicutes bacterium]|nr:hypothetical protein [Bacillota bacterium]